MSRFPREDRIAFVAQSLCVAVALYIASFAWAVLP